MSSSNDHATQLRVAWIGAGAVVVAAVLTFLGIILGRTTPVLSNVISAPTVTTTATTTATVTAKPPSPLPKATSSTTSTVEGEPGVPTAGKENFTEVADYVDSSGGIMDDDATATLRGNILPHSLQAKANCQSDYSGDVTYDYSIPAHFQKLTGTLGIDDQSVGSGPIEWRVYLNRAATPDKSGRLSPGETYPLDVDVSDAYRIRLFINDPKAPRVSCGNSGITVFDWGSLTLTS